MNRDIKQKELLFTQHKIEELKESAGFFKRNKLKTILVGAVITALGPLYIYNSGISGTSRMALEKEGTSQLELSIWLGIFYSVAVIIANIIWTKQEKKRLIYLKEQEKIIQMELELFFKE